MPQKKPIITSLTGVNWDKPGVSTPKEKKPAIKKTTKPAIKDITTKNLPPAKGLGGPDLSTVDAELARLFSGHVPRSGMFGPVDNSKPHVTGRGGIPASPEVESLVEEYSRIIPDVVGNITGFGSWIPTNIPKYETQPGTLGLFWPDIRGIYLDPYQTPSELETTLAHELAHSTGYPHNRSLYNIEGVGRMRGEAKEMWKNKQKMKGMGTR